jgi:hypothetical protein
MSKSHARRRDEEGGNVPEAEGSREQRKSRRKQRKVSSGMRWMALSSLAGRARSALECEADSSTVIAIAWAASPPPSSCCCCCCLGGLAERLSCLCIFVGARWCGVARSFSSVRLGAGALKCGERDWTRRLGGLVWFELQAKGRGTQISRR